MVAKTSLCEFALYALAFILYPFLVPNYEYKCTNDGSTFELWQEVGSSAPPCPDCGAPTKKVFQPPRVIFKGSGFYVTDKRAESGGQKSQAAGDDKSGDKSAAPAETSSETSSETKTEAKTDAPSQAPKTEAKTPASD